MTDSLSISFFILGSGRLQKTDLVRAVRLFVSGGFFPGVRVDGRMRRVEREADIPILLETNFKEEVEPRSRLAWTFGFALKRKEDVHPSFVDIMQPVASPMEIVGHFGLDAESKSEADAQLGRVVDLVRSLFLELGGAVALVDREGFIDRVRQDPDSAALAWFTIVNKSHNPDFPIDAVSRAPIWRVDEVESGILEVQISESLIVPSRRVARSVAKRLREHFHGESVQLKIGALDAGDGGSDL